MSIKITKVNIKLHKLDDLVVINTWNCCLLFYAVVFAGISFDERFGLSCPTKDIE